VGFWDLCGSNADAFNAVMAVTDHGLRALRCIQDIDAWRVMTPSFDLQMRASNLVTAPVLQALAPLSAAALIADARATLLTVSVAQRRLVELLSGPGGMAAAAGPGGPRAVVAALRESRDGLPVDEFFACYAAASPVKTNIRSLDCIAGELLWNSEAVIFTTPAAAVPFPALSDPNADNIAMGLLEAPAPQSSVTRITIFAAESSFAHVAAVLEGVGVWSVMSRVPRAVRAILLDPAGCDHGSGDEIEGGARGSGSDEDEGDEDGDEQCDASMDSHLTRNELIDRDFAKRNDSSSSSGVSPTTSTKKAVVEFVFRDRAYCVTVVLVPSSLQHEAETSLAAPMPALPGVTTAAVALAAATAARGGNVYSRAAAGADAVVVLAAAATDVVTDDGEPAALHAVVARLASAFEGTGVTHESVIAYAAALRGQVFASAAASAGAGVADAVAGDCSDGIAALQPRPPPAFLRLAMRPEAAVAAKTLPAPFPVRIGKGGEADSVLVVPSGQILSASGPMLLEWVARAVPARPSGGSYDLTVPRRCLRLPLPTASG
jgi:hypothetical protein